MTEAELFAAYDASPWLCMSAEEYALWRRGQRYRKNPSPCFDCPASWAAQMRSEGRCIRGHQTTGRPRRAPVQKRRQWASAEEKAAHVRRLTSARKRRYRERLKARAATGPPYSILGSAVCQGCRALVWWSRGPGWNLARWRNRDGSAHRCER